MRKLTIEALSPEVARGLYAALAGFDAELLEDGDGKHNVAVAVTNGDGEARAVIAAISQFVEQHREGEAKPAA